MAHQLPAQRLENINGDIKNVLPFLEVRTHSSHPPSSNFTLSVSGASQTYYYILLVTQTFLKPFSHMFTNNYVTSLTLNYYVTHLRPYITMSHLRP